jgi:hypothetical protein
MSASAAWERCFDLDVGLGGKEKAVTEGRGVAACVCCGCCVVETDTEEDELCVKRGRG